MNPYIKHYQNKANMLYTESLRVKNLFTDTIVYNGIARWKSNGNIPPQDILEFWNFLGFDFDYDATSELRQVEDDEAIQRLKNRYNKLTSEDIHELRGAFGPGQKIVNILTGETFNT